MVWRRRNRDSQAPAPGEAALNGDETGVAAEVRDEAEAIEQSVALYAAQLERLGKLEEAAWRHEVALQELSSRESLTAAIESLERDDGSGEAPVYLAPLLDDGDTRREALPPVPELLREVRRLARKAQQYDELLEEAKKLRYKARRHDELLEEVVKLRPKAAQYERFREEVKELRPKAAQYERLRDEVSELRAAARQSKRQDAPPPAGG
jgi:hypothetical protein